MKHGNAYRHSGNSYPIELQERIKIAGERKEQIKLHIGQVLNIEYN